MSMSSNSNPDRLYELLADQALYGLDEAAARELEALLASDPNADAEAFDRAAAALDLAIASAPDAEELPAGLRSSLESAAQEFIAGNTPAPTQTQAQDHEEAPAVLAKLSWAPWLVAAASLTIAAFVWVNAPTPQGVRVITAASAYDAFLTSAPQDLVRVDWQAVAKNYDMPSEGFSGEVVWSGSAQEGFMVFEGLPPNDPGVEQFQLWIIDSTRGDSPPVDGGVFDVDSSGRVIVPIHPAIAIGSAAAFAVTVEQPGGVVVSTQDRIATLAAIEQG